MPLRLTIRTLATGLIASILIPALATAATPGCGYLTGKDRALCEINMTKGRPIRRQAKAKARTHIKEHRKAIKDASTVSSASSTSSSSSSSSTSN
jgi:hypothetical protein